MRCARTRRRAWSTPAGRCGRSAAPATGSPRPRPGAPRGARRSSWSPPCASSARCGSPTPSPARTAVKREVLNVSDTLAAQDKARELAERFADWVWEDTERAETLARVYNERFNAIVLRSYDSAGPDTMALPGLAQGFTPRPHQYAAVARMIAEPGVLLAHEVGAGKTAAMSDRARWSCAGSGWCASPPSSFPTTSSSSGPTSSASLYPRARLLIATKADLTAARRREFVARAATGDWDAVVMTHSAFERLPMSLETQRAYLDREAEEMQRWLDALVAAGERQSPSVKRVQRMLLAAQERVKAKLDSATDPGVTFEQTGIDQICVDEAHLFKNLRTPSNIAGAAIDGSQRAQDLDMKLWWLRSRQGARVVTLATATPIANSITETWVMQRYTRPDLLDDAGITTFDQWAATFGRVVTTVEMTPDATGFRLHDRFARFTNVPELLRLWHVSADIKTAADLDLPVPALAERPEDGARAPRTVLISPSPALREFVTGLGARAERIRAKAVHPSEDNMLKVCSEGRAAALDLRLLGRPQPGPAPIDHAAATITRIWRAHRADVFTRPDGTPHPVPGALQIVFADLGTPSSAGAAGTGFDIYHALRERLAARGMPAEAIRFVHDAATDAAKAALFAAARSGEVAVLIGSTEKMGVGHQRPGPRGRPAPPRVSLATGRPAPTRRAHPAPGQPVRRGGDLPLHHRRQLRRLPLPDRRPQERVHRPGHARAPRRPRDRGHRGRHPELRRSQGVGVGRSAGDREGPPRRRGRHPRPARTRPPPGPGPAAPDRDPGRVEPGRARRRDRRHRRRPRRGAARRAARRSTPSSTGSASPSAAPTPPRWPTRCSPPRGWGGPGTAASSGRSVRWRCAPRWCATAAVRCSSSSSSPTPPATRSPSPPASSTRARSGWCPPSSAATPGSRPAAATPRPPRKPPGPSATGPAPSSGRRSRAPRSSPRNGPEPPSCTRP